MVSPLLFGLAGFLSGGGAVLVLLVWLDSRLRKAEDEAWDSLRAASRRGESGIHTTQPRIGARTQRAARAIGQ